ncbi:MAG: hypothetical protein CME62_11320 [Halobacteriovoraceae bacterium]|nr:hypothetical protein [Halobacteriovoraceae bacterium]|tara:strand:+ start:40233 stop:40886 length:654 start_codon:yes stop_codon:yes gene_type:complete
MIKSTIIFTLFFLIHQAQANEFKFNNKNLNSLGAIICQSAKSPQENNIIAHKININKHRVSDKHNDFKYEVIGTCDIHYNTQKKKITTLGDEFHFSFYTNRFGQIEGRYGIKKLFFNFRKKTLHSLVIIDPLLQTTKRIYLSQSQWAKNDTIFNFDRSKLQVKISRKTAAVEKNSLLEFNDKLKTTYYNLWSFESFGCSGLAGQNQEQCQKIVSEIN